MLSLLLAQRNFMNSKKENYWYMFRVLLLMNVVLVAVIVLAHPVKPETAKKEEPSCSSSKKVSAEVLNVINVKLM